MSGNLSMAELEQAVAEGAIDTVLVAQIDMQGRLMGKRFQAEFFLRAATRDPQLQLPARHRPRDGDGAGLQGDELGRGLWRLHDEARPRHAAPVPWLPGTALVLADVLDHHATPRCRIRRARC